MTSWVTFETIDESQNWDQFYIDRLGMHQYSKDNRTRFHIVRGTQPEKLRTDWVVWDLESEDDREDYHSGTMRDVIQWVSGRILYGV